MTSTDINGEPILILTKDEALALFDVIIAPLAADVDSTMRLYNKVSGFLRDNTDDFDPH